MDKISPLLIFIPSILGFSSAMACKVSEQSGSKVSFRPPPIVFSIIWPILYILLGISWYISFNKNQTIFTYLFLNLILCSWIIIYSCLNRKVIAIFSLIFGIALLSYIIYSENIISKFLLIPLLLWLIFAIILNIAEIMN